jgi:serine/threonine protein kinase
LKPANILLEGRAGQEITKITDFGIARIIETGGERLTSSGINPGTPKYMSPEQIQGIKNIDHRSDIYSLGILLYQLITGQTPFNNDSYASILISHINDPPPPLSEICPNADMRLEKVIQKALAKSPHDRFQSCKEFALALQWCLCSITLAENKNMHTLDIPPITASKEDNRKTISIPVEEMVAQIVQSLQDIDKKQPQLSAQHEPYSEDHKPDTQTPIERMELEPINIVAEFSSDEINAIGKQRNYYMAAIFAILLFVSAGLLFWPNTKQNTEKSPFAPPLNAKHPNNAMLKSSHDQIAVLTQTSPNIHSSTPLHTATHKTTDKIKSTPAKTTNSAKPIAVYMEIDTEPSGASIYIDQKLLGKTPMRIPTIKHHPITFRIQLSGYIEREISWDGKQNRPKQIYYLAPSPF